MFIHYGIYSQVGRGEWLMSRERIPFEEYSKLAQTFAPTKDVCREWTRLAKSSGMKYMCLTTRHHDGFCLFDTGTTGYNSVKSPCKRDIVKEYVEACRKDGLGVGLYYSVGNWSDAGCIAGPKNKELCSDFIATNYEQLHELMTNYGKIDYIFYDGCPPPETIGMAELNNQIRKWQPDILISERVICGIKNQVKNILLLETGEDISFKQDLHHIYLTGLSMPTIGTLRRVLRLEIVGEPEGMVNPLMDSSRFRID